MLQPTALKPSNPAFGGFKRGEWSLQTKYNQKKFGEIKRYYYLCIDEKREKSI